MNPNIKEIELNKEYIEINKGLKGTKILKKGLEIIR